LNTKIVQIHNRHSLRLKEYDYTQPGPAEGGVRGDHLGESHTVFTNSEVGVLAGGFIARLHPKIFF
jgi:hypothetical protein